MKKSVKVILIVLLVLIIGGIALNFYLDHFIIAYVLMGVLLKFISGWGAFVYVKNDVNMNMNMVKYKRNNYTDDIEYYTR